MAEKKPILRNEKGQVLPGQALNPGGRPKGAEKLIREAIPHDDWVAMAKVMRDIVMGKLPEGINAITEVKPQDRVKAWVALHDRGWGKPKISLDITDMTSASGIASINVDELDDEAFDKLEREIQKVLHGNVIDVESTEK